MRYRVGEENEMRLSVLALALLGCRGDVEPGIEGLNLPDDPSVNGVPVGVRTVDYGGLTLEVWYPASDSDYTDPEILDLMDHAPASVLALLPGLEVPPITTTAFRDAPVRNLADPVPALIFSHGFGGMRTQSVDLTAHLASRGYVVVATDHDGRDFDDVLPCLFSPPLDGCSMALEDPAPPDVDRLIDWLHSDTFLGDLPDPALLGLFGHSAGGGTSMTVANEDSRVVAALSMASEGSFERDLPTMTMAGSCDAAVPIEGVEEELASGSDTHYVRLEGAGHMAFSDLCAVDWVEIHDDHLADRDDLNTFIVELMLALGTDGCPPHAPQVDSCDAFVEPAVSERVIRHYATVFFDDALLGAGPGVEDGLFPEALAY